MKIDRPWQFGEIQAYVVGKRRYDVNSAILLAADLPVKDLVIDDLYLNYSAPCDDNFRSFLEHMKSVNEANLDYPILFNQDGVIIDGRHRLAKAILAGHETIKAKRFITDPPGCYTTVG